MQPFTTRHLVALFALGIPITAIAARLAPTTPQAEALRDEQPFLKDNNAAMTRMMSGMATRPTGDIDGDFAAMMIPHHQGAIDMAVAELRYGHNEQLRRISQEIIVDQQQEIAAMRLALGERLPAAAPVPTQSPNGPGCTPATHIQDTDQ